jgi:AraC-like DNA-binding protein
VADILLLVEAPRAAERVRRALNLEAAAGSRHALHPAPSWPGLFDLAASVPALIAFVDPYHGGTFAPAQLARLRARFPALELVAYADFTNRAPAEPFALAGVGVRAIVALDVGDEPAALARCLAAHLRWTPFEDLLEALRARLPPRLFSWLEPVLRSTGPNSVAACAARARCSPRTLRRTVRAAGLPTPEEILAWRALLHAARLMEDSGRSVESIARTLELSSGAALRRSLKRLTGLRPGELAARGGLRLMTELFLERCFGARAAEVSRERPLRGH